ncbi:EPS depolymerase [Pantoea phage vB_PagM_LIET2]|uniref:Structural protein containing EPS-depolymerase domain n=1 Tax=Pantoea phage vB_PagM_LIET2 TaxID=2508071 RepID=A0A411AW71_9CAUD|nr:EPS depolymerase [Pantoea phage vB_PagM_LIET2]QAX92336.1 structural protein containing EPS-depolymerase domain [Pantoea phage vB_PagM_LIET2]
MSTMNGGAGGILVLPGQNGGTAGNKPTSKPQPPSLQDIISGSEKTVLFALITEFLKLNPDAVSAADPKVIKAAVIEYLDQNPITAGLDAAAVQGLINTSIQAIRQGHTDTEIQNIINTFIATNPPSFNDAVKKYLKDNPVSGGGGLGEDQINDLIELYIAANGYNNDASDINNLIQGWIASHPISATIDPAVLTKAITDYLKANPVVPDSDAVEAAVTAYFNAHPPAAGVSPAQMTKALSDLLASTDFTTAVVASIKAEEANLLAQDAFKNAVNGMITAALTAKDFTADITAAINQYFSTHPQRTDAQVKALVAAWINDNPQGLSQAEVEAAIVAYLTANPPGDVSAADIEAAVNTYLGAHPPSGGVREFASFDLLCKAKPSKEGERVWLANHNPRLPAGNMAQGQGYFVGHIVTSSMKYRTPDGGLFAGVNTDKTYFWIRDISLEELNVTHFGAMGVVGVKSDNRAGAIDDSPALIAMYDCLKSAQTKAIFPNSEMAPVKFPAGAYMINPVDLTTRGAKTSDAKMLEARKKAIWTASRKPWDGNKFGQGVGTGGANVSKWENVDVDAVKNSTNADIKKLYVEFPASENHNGYEQAGFFGMTGPSVPYGRAPQVTIFSNKQQDSYVIDLKHSLCVIQGIEFDGEIKEGFNWNTDATKGPINGPAFTGTIAGGNLVVPSAPSNNQGFLHNWRNSGQYYSVTNFRAQSVGGRTFDVKDTLDSQFDQIYSGQCWGEVICVGWTNIIEGAWNHSTAVEISNSNFQQMLSKPAIVLARTAQSIVRNVWIEHSLCPADFSLSHLIMDMFCVESSNFDVHAWNSRITLNNLSNPTGVNIDLDTGPYLTGVTSWDPATWKINPKWHSNIALPDGSAFPSWDKYFAWPGGSYYFSNISAYEPNHLHTESYGIETRGTIKTGYSAGWRLQNYSEKEMWVRCGTFQNQQANGSAQAAWKASDAGKAYTESVIDFAYNAWLATAAGQAADDAAKTAKRKALSDGAYSKFGSGGLAGQTNFINSLTHWEIDVMGSRMNGKARDQLGFPVSPMNDEMDPLANTTEGLARINILNTKNANSQYTDTGGMLNWITHGDSCILDVRLSEWSGTPALWVKLAPWTLACSFFIRSTGNTHFEAGSWSMFKWDGSMQEMAPGAAGSIPIAGGLKAGQRKWSVHNDKAGIGINTDGTISLATAAPAKLPTTIDIASVQAWVQVNIGGVDCLIPAIKIPT